MNPDGIQYLDNPSAYRQGDFRDALNPQWSPLYPWPIAGAEAMVRPSREQGVRARARRQFHTFRGVDCVLLFFLKSMPSPASTSFLLVSYAAFLYCSLDFTHLYVTLDLLVNCFAFIVAGLLARMSNGDATLNTTPHSDSRSQLDISRKRPFFRSRSFVFS
jgi:hypothetical protein